MPVQMDRIKTRPAAMSAELNSWQTAPAKNGTTLKPGHRGARALAPKTGGPLFGRGMLTGNIMHSDDNEKESPSPSFCPAYFFYIL